MLKRPRKCRNAMNEENCFHSRISVNFQNHYEIENVIDIVYI